MDFEAVRAGIAQAIPFNGFVGVEYLEVGDGVAKALLPERPELLNHVGSQHAGGLFTLAEAASGGAFVGAFAEHLGGLTPLAERAEITYKKIAKGPITATATLTTAKDEILATLESDGRARFPIEIELANAAGERVAEATVHWYVKKN